MCMAPRRRSYPPSPSVTLATGRREAIERGGGGGALSPRLETSGRFWRATALAVTWYGVAWDSGKRWGRTGPRASVAQDAAPPSSPDADVAVSVATVTPATKRDAEGTSTTSNNNSNDDRAAARQASGHALMTLATA